MRKPLWIPALALGLVSGFRLAPEARTAPPLTQLDLQQISEASADLAATALEATVHLFVDDAGERQTGSGFVIDAIRGLIVTNGHVVGEEANVRVILHDGRESHADVIAIDSKTDLAVIRIPEGFAHNQIAWGDSDSLRPGSLVMAIGNPQRLDFTTSMGVISALNRQIGIGRPGAYEDFLQFDAFIAPGSSGGPLIDMSGRVVGINTAIAGRQWSGVSYAVPSALARRIASDLVRFERVRRGYLGVESDDVNSSRAELAGLSRPYGVVINKVREGTPAADAGIAIGDIILEVNGREVAGQQQLRARISTIPPGDWVKLKIWRNGRAIDKQIKLALLDETP